MLPARPGPRLAAALAWMLAALSAAPAMAEDEFREVRLADGRAYRGVVVGTSDAGLQIRIPAGVVDLPFDDILEVLPIDPVAAAQGTVPRVALLPTGSSPEHAALGGAVGRMVDETARSFQGLTLIAPADLSREVLDRAGACAREVGCLAGIGTDLKVETLIEPVLEVGAEGLAKLRLLAVLVPGRKVAASPELGFVAAALPALAQELPRGFSQALRIVPDRLPPAPAVPPLPGPAAGAGEPTAPVAPGSPETAGGTAPVADGPPATGAEPVVGGTGATGSEPLASGTGTTGPEPANGGAGATGSEPLASGTGTTGPEPANGGAGATGPAASPGDGPPGGGTGARATGPDVAPPGPPGGTAASLDGPGGATEPPAGTTVDAEAGPPAPAADAAPREARVGTVVKRPRRLGTTIALGFLPLPGIGNAYLADKPGFVANLAVNVAQGWALVYVVGLYAENSRQMVSRSILIPYLVGVAVNQVTGAIGWARTQGRARPQVSVMPEFGPEGARGVAVGLSARF